MIAVGVMMPGMMEQDEVQRLLDERSRAEAANATVNANANANANAEANRTDAQLPATITQSHTLHEVCGGQGSMRASRMGNRG